MCLKNVVITELKADLFLSRKVDIDYDSWSCVSRFHALHVGYANVLFGKKKAQTCVRVFVYVTGAGHLQ